MPIKELQYLKKDPLEHNGTPSQSSSNINKASKKFYIESYGCQMNFSDSEVVASILINDGYTLSLIHI